MVYNHIRGVGTYGPLRGAHKDVGRGAFLPLNVKSGEVTSPIIVLSEARRHGVKGR